MSTVALENTAVVAMVDALRILAARGRAIREAEAKAAHGAGVPAQGGSGELVKSIVAGHIQPASGSRGKALCL